MFNIATFFIFFISYNMQILYHLTFPLKKLIVTIKEMHILRNKPLRALTHQFFIPGSPPSLLVSGIESISD